MKQPNNNVIATKIATWVWKLRTTCQDKFIPTLRTNSIIETTMMMTIAVEDVQLV